MGIAKVKQIFTGATALSLAVLLLLSLFTYLLPAPRVEAVAYGDQANSYCQVQFTPQPVATTPGASVPDPDAIKHRRIYCVEGFVYALRNDAPIPATQPTSPQAHNDYCYTNIYPRTPDAQYPCEVGYVYAYYHKAEIKKEAKDAKEPPTPSEKEAAKQSKYHSDGYSACVQNHNPGGVTNKEVLLEECEYGYVAAMNGKDRNACNKRAGFTLDGIDKQYCLYGYDLAKNAGGAAGDANAAGDDETSSCGGGLSLGWIICGITETVQNFGQTIFKDFIQPMMEKNPISTDPKDPFYQSWQGFRFLANILVVVSLLAIVYSQTRGGGGR